MTIFVIACMKKCLEAVAQRCSVKKVFSEISQNTQENTCARVSFIIKLQASECFLIKSDQILLKKALKLKVKVTDISGANSNQIL